MGDESKRAIPNYEDLGLTKEDLYDVEKSMKFWTQLSEEDFVLRIVHDIKHFSNQIIGRVRVLLMHPDYEDYYATNLSERQKVYDALVKNSERSFNLAEILRRYFEHHRAQGDDDSEATWLHFSEMGFTQDDLRDIEKSMPYWVQMPEMEFILWMVHDIKMHAIHVFQSIQNFLMHPVFYNELNIKELREFYEEWVNSCEDSIQSAGLVARYFEHHRVEGDDGKNPPSTAPRDSGSSPPIS